MADFGKLDFSVSFRPQSAFPLDARSYFESYDLALEKAATAQLAGGTDSRYYVGQVLAVCDTATSATTYYKINQDRKLTKIIDADFLSGYVTNGKNYKVQLAETGAYVNVPWESGGGGGTTVEVDDVTIKKNASNQIYVAGVPLSVRSAISATSSNFGTIKLGYPQNERNYPLQLSTDGKAYVSVPWTDTPTPASAISADLTSVFQTKGSYLTAVPAATDAAIGGIKTGYSGSGKNYPLSLDADSKAFVHVPWESGSNVDVDNDTLSTNASGKLYVRQILSSQVSGLGTFAAKSSLLSTDIPALNSTKISDLGDLATKDESELDFASKATTLAGYGITDAKIENGVSITLGDTTISVLTAHQDITGKANLADILTASVAGDSTKTKLGLKSDLSIDVLTAHQSLAEYVTTSKLTGFTTDTDAHNYQVQLSSSGYAYVHIPIVNGNATYPLVDLGSGGNATLLNASVNKLSADSTHSIIMTIPDAEPGATTLRDMVALIYGYTDNTTTTITATGTNVTLYSDDIQLFSDGIVKNAVVMFTFSEIDTNKFAVARKDLVTI